VRGRAASPKVGIFETGSHRVVDIPRCLVHHPLVNDVAAALKQAMIATRATAYSDDAHKGLVRYVQVVVERRTQTAQVVLVTNDDRIASSERLLDALSDKLGPRLHSLFWNGNTERTNVIVGPAWEKRRGPDAVEEMIGGARVFFPPGAFGQNNLDLADALVLAVHAQVPDDARVVELYGGTGAIGLGLAARASSLVVNELSTDSLRGLEMGIRALPDDVRDPSTP
jgi:tRNA/tmRNA/rRNA uracil-C5-methylase (TrmA/RlmC/RlmD family)